MPPKKLIPDDVRALTDLPEMRGLRSDKQRSFVLAKVFGGLNNKQAACAAGYSAASDESLSAQGSRLAADPAVVAACEVLTRLVMRSTSIDALRKLEYLMHNATEEKLQAQCARDILDRGGFNPTVKYDVTHTHEMTLAEADRVLANLLAQAGLSEGQAQKLLGHEAIIDAEFETVEPEPAAVDDDLADIL